MEVQFLEFDEIIELSTKAANEDKAESLEIGSYYPMFGDCVQAA